MNHFEDNETKAIDDILEEEHYYYLLNHYQSVFLELEGVARVLGKEHPVTRLMEGAVDSLDAEELNVALAAYEALPKHVIHKINHPWIGHPPPPGTREELRGAVAPKLVGEGTDWEPVGCYLRVDARERFHNEIGSSVDRDGHVVDPALVYDLRVHEHGPVRVEIREGADKALVLELLKKISDRLNVDWDRLTDPAHYSEKDE